MSVECVNESIPAGYKQTEVGVIPEDWEVIKLSDIGDIIRGASPRPKGDKRFYGGNVPRLMVEDVTRDGKYVSPQIDFLTEEGAKRSRPCKKGTLTLVCSGTVGIPSFLGVDACIHDGLLALVSIRKNVSDDYLYHQLHRLKENVENSATHGGVFTNLTTASVKEFKVSLPPLAEQESIATALSDTDALIESLEQLIAKKRQIKQGAMQELLTWKRRLPGFSGEWEVKNLGKIAEIRSGGTPSTTQPQFWDGDIFWCTPTDITALNGHKYLIESSRKITVQGLKCSSAEMIPSYSIVMTSRATIGECAINQVPVSTNQGFKNLIPSENVDVEFLYYLLLTKKQEFISLCGGSTFLEIGKTQLSLFEVELPSTKEEQTAIATILSDMDSEITLLEEKLGKTRQIKQGMMQELLTGRIRLV